MKNSQPQIYRAWKLGIAAGAWIGQLVFLRGDCFQKSIVPRPSHTSPCFRGSFPRLYGSLWSGAVSGRGWRPNMSQQFFQIYIFLREASVICSRVSREKVTLDEILLKREMIECKEKFVIEKMNRKIYTALED